MKQITPTATRRARERGLSLVVVMTVLVLGSLLALGSARTAWLNEKLVGAQSEHQRTVAAAQALLKDAESDIRGERADGTPCNTEPAATGCRGAREDQRPFFPVHAGDIATVSSRLGGQPCRQGICLPGSVNALQPPSLTAQLLEQAVTGASSSADDSLGATHGQFTGVTTTGHPLLGGASARAWYWVEVFHYDINSPQAFPAGHPWLPDASHPFVYRINAYVQGHKAGTRVWLRSLFIWKPPAHGGS